MIAFFAEFDPVEYNFDDDAADDDDEKRFLPNCKRRLLVNAFDALVVRVVRYKSIVFVVTERVREKRISVCLVFFQKELPFWRKRPIRKASQKRISLEHFA